MMKFGFHRNLSRLRETYATLAQRIINDETGIFFSRTQRINGQVRYNMLSKEGLPSSIPQESGVYVIYSRRTDKPIYVGESDNLNKRILNHIRASGKSIFKDRWVPCWMHGKPSKKDVVGFIHQICYAKTVAVPFGRKEIEEEFRRAWKIRDAQSVKSRV